MTHHDSLRNWCSFHFFYHGNQDRLLASLVAPAVTHFYQTKMIERFFFIRYSLGGPHIRLRLQCHRDRVEEIEAYLRLRAKEFFEHWPSTTAVPANKIQAQNVAILSQAPLETNDQIYPDQHMERFEFHPEIERYGGPALLEDSLDLFEASSMEALHLSIVGTDWGRSRRLPHLFRLLLNQALGFSESADLQRWTTYGSYFFPILPAINQAADLVFDKHETQLRALFAKEFERASYPYLMTASRRLAHLVRGTDEEVRERILMSQLHMTANRTGLSNYDELYVCRLLQRAGKDQFAACTEDPLHPSNNEIETLRCVSIEKLSERALSERSDAGNFLAT